MYYIHINMHIIRANRDAAPEDLQPPITIKRGKHTKIDDAFEIRIIGDSRLVYDAHEKILNCGARMVLVADGYEKIR